MAGLQYNHAEQNAGGGIPDTIRLTTREDIISRNEQFYLGCPIWSNKAWVGELFSSGARAGDFLREYSVVFHTVEGNTTFYAVPSEGTVERWREETPERFRFCFKFPRTISHDRRLADTQAETEHFLNVMSLLGSRLGPFFLQLPPSFGPDELPLLDLYLRRLSHEFSYAVEVRHPAFFDGGPNEEDLNGLLAALGIDRVIFDARALFSAEPLDAHTWEAQRKKPDLPVRPVATGPRPFVRFVAHPEVEANEAWLSEWAERVAGWIEEGLTPYFFVHAPDDFYAPRLARIFHRLLGEQVEIDAMPPWPAEQEGPPTGQLSLF